MQPDPCPDIDDSGAFGRLQVENLFDEKFGFRAGNQHGRIHRESTGRRIPDVLRCIEPVRRKCARTMASSSRCSSSLVKFPLIVRVEVGFIYGQAVREQDFRIQPGAGHAVLFEAFDGLPECVAEGHATCVWSSSSLSVWKCEVSVSRISPRSPSMMKSSRCRVRPMR